MANREERVDQYVEALQRIDDESLASLSSTPGAQALYEEVTTMGSSLRAGRSRRRRLVWQGAIVVGAAVIVLAVLSVVNVFGSGGPTIVEKAVAALDPSDNAIIHVKITGHESGKDGYSSTWTEENWSRTSVPYTIRAIQAFEGSPVLETLQDGTGLGQTYDAATNTIYQPAQNDMFRVESGQSDPYRDMILEMLRSGDAVVEGNETVEGRDCIRIAATKDYGTASDGTKYGTWYVVDADTKNPVEWLMTRDGGKVVNIRFDVYEQLPVNDQNLALLDLAAQHPGATLNTSSEDYQNSLDQPAPPPEGKGDATDKK